MANEYLRQGSLEPADFRDRTETCPACMGKIYPGGRFCSECGRPLLPQNHIRELLIKARERSIEFKDKKDYQRALQCLLEVLPIATAENDAFTLNMIGLRYSQAGNREKALEYYLKAYACDPAGSLTSLYLNNIALQYYYRNDFKNAEFFFSRAEEMLKVYPDQANTGTVFLNYARCLGKNGELGKAREYLELAEKNGQSKEECDEVWASFR